MEELHLGNSLGMLFQIRGTILGTLSNWQTACNKYTSSYTLTIKKITLSWCYRIGFSKTFFKIHVESFIKK